MSKLFLNTGQKLKMACPRNSKGVPPLSQRSFVKQQIVDTNYQSKPLPASIDYKISRPNVPELTINQKQGIEVLIFIGVENRCDDANKLVDYIINWLIDDGIVCTKYDKSNPIATKYPMSKTPAIIIERNRVIIRGVEWKGIALTYRAIIEVISGL